MTCEYVTTRARDLAEELMLKQMSSGNVHCSDLRVLACVALGSNQVRVLRPD